MSETPPNFAAYPRQNAGLEVDRLQALANGYYGLNITFLINILLLLVVDLVIGMAIRAGFFVRFGIATAVVGTIVAIISYPYNRKIGYGAKWSSTAPLVASILIGLNSAFCCGIIGYVVIQNIALGHIKKFGVRSGFLGPRKRDVAAVVAQLQNERR